MASKKKTGLVPGGAGLLAEIDVAADAGGGLEEVGAEDQVVPRLSLVQGTSNILKQSSPAYVATAEAGMIHDTVSGKLHDGEAGVLVIPCAYQRRWVERAEPADGQQYGFTVAEHRPDSQEFLALVSDATDEKGDWGLRNGNTLIDTRRYFVLLLDEAAMAAEPRVVEMIRTSKKHSKTWNARMLAARMVDPTSGRGFSPPSYAQQFRLGSAVEVGKQNEYRVWKPAPAGFVDSAPLYLAGKALAESVRDGAVGAAREEPAADEGITPAFQV